MKNLFLIVLMAISLNTFADLREDELKNTIVTVETSVVEENYVEARNTSDSPPKIGDQIKEISIIIDGILAIGKKIWPIIDAGRPVINTNLAPMVSIIPVAVEPNVTLNKMDNWSEPNSLTLKVSAKNGFGSEVVGFKYTVIFQYNGSYDGVGKYITNLKVIPSNIYSAWGFDFDANSELVGIANVGTKNSPVASGIIAISYKIKGKLNEMRQADAVYVDGNGTIKIVNQ